MWLWVCERENELGGEDANNLKNYPATQELFFDDRTKKTAFFVEYLIPNHRYIGAKKILGKKKVPI